MTLTPSRAVSIFRTEEADAGRAGNSGRRHPKKEALPWWIFGIVGGLLTAWLAPRFLAGHLGLPAAPAEEASSLAQMVVLGRNIRPGLLVGLAVGWFLIGPVNAVLGWFFRGFNRVFDGITAAYGWTVGKLLRLSVIVLVVYGGLLGLTVVAGGERTDRLHPHAGSGLSARQRPVARLRLGATDRRDPDQDRPDRPRHPRRGPRIPGVAHTVGVSGESFLTTTNGSNLGTMFVGLKPFEQRTSRDRVRRGDRRARFSSSAIRRSKAP